VIKDSPDIGKLSLGKLYLPSKYVAQETQSIKTEFETNGFLAMVKFKSLHFAGGVTKDVVK